MLQGVTHDTGDVSQVPSNIACRMRPEVIEGDVRDVLHALEDESVQCVVTSPPFWGLRDYGTGTWEGGDEDCNHRTGDQVTQTLHELSVYHRRDSPVGSGVRPGSDNSECKNCGAKKIDKQLGLETTPEEYVENLVSVFQEVKRVLRKDGTVWLNLGDSFMNKNLVGIPWRVAFALQADGWHLRSDIIWNKPNPMPEAVKDRPTRCHEYIFLLTKSRKYYYDYDAIKEPVLDSSIKRSMYGWDCDRPGTKNASRGGDGIHVEKMGSRFVDPSGRNKRSVWKINTKPYKEAHFATFPEELPETCIKAGTSQAGCCADCGTPWVIEREQLTTPEREPRLNRIGVIPKRDKACRMNSKNMESIVWGMKGWKANCDCNAEKVPCVVLDIFAGSGTTLRVASKLGRKGIGIELNPEYIKILKKRCRIDSESLLDFGVPLH